MHNHSTLLARPALAVALVTCLAATGCPKDRTDSAVDAGTDSGTDAGPLLCPPGTSIDAFLPAVPGPTGDPQAAFAGIISDASELIAGKASTGMTGDYFLRNDRVRLVIQRPSEFFAWTRYGGNIIDADIVRGGGDPDNDHFGKMSPIYRSGRTANFESCEVLQDGSGGGAAAIRCFGADTRIDSLNLPGFIPIPLDVNVHPHEVTPLEIAVTYVLEPGADAVEVVWTFHNTSGEDALQTNLGFMIDTGGEIEVFQPGDGFGALDFGALLSGGVSSAWYGYQGPGVAYGVVPYHFDATGAIESIDNAQITISGVSVAIFSVASLLEAFSAPAGRLNLAACDGWSQTLDFVVAGSSVGEIGTYAMGSLGLDNGTVTGTVNVGGVPAEGVRVIVLEDRGMAGVLDGNDVSVASYETDASGVYIGNVEVGDYLVTTDLPGLPLDPNTVDGTLSVSVTSAGLATADFDLPAAATIEYEVTDDMGVSIPARIMVVGDDSSPNDRRLRDFEEGKPPGTFWNLINAIRFSTTGSSAMDGGGFTIEPGSYRVFFSRGTEWSVADQLITVASGDTAMVAGSLTHVIDTSGYVAADMHQHSVNSPDAPVTLEDRVMVYAAEGIEFIGASDHDFLTDYAPVISALGVSNIVESSIGVETTTFDYGHFNSWPHTIDPTNPNGGIVDWANGSAEPNLTPTEFFMELRTRGVDAIQVNHPRSGFQGYFDRAALTFDFTSGYVGDHPSGYVLGPDVLFLPPGEPLFTPDFDALEIWNGWHVDDTNMDGIAEDERVDTILKDWFRFTAFGLIYTGMANSDSHTHRYDFGGYPRTYVSVPDDTAIGSLEAEVLATMSGASARGRDVVLTNGPMLRVATNPGAMPAVGETLDGTSGMVTLDITIDSPEWAPFDTLEIFVNTDDANDDLSPAGSSALIPTLCYTDRTGLPPADSCGMATAGTPMPLGVVMSPVGSEVVHTVNVTVPITITEDSFIFVRAYGNSGIFPVILHAIGAGVTPADVVAGTADFSATGVPAMALAGPVLVDFDGNGSFDAPYAP